jgi:tRNA A37 methylthiotransferase MiaB
MMRRPEYSEEIGSFISQVQDKNNRAVWRTDLIVGWPTETQDELDHSLAFAVKHFDEIATYAIELSPDLPAWKYQDKSFSREELNRRVAYSKQFITKHGKMAHCGQQDDSTMAEVEKQRLKMRQERLSSIQIVEI